MLLIILCQCYYSQNWIISDTKLAYVCTHTCISSCCTDAHAHTRLCLCGGRSSVMGVLPNHSPPQNFETCLEVQEIWNNLSFQWSKGSLTGQNFLAICVQGSLPSMFRPSSRINDEQHSPCVLFGCSRHKFSSLDLQKKKLFYQLNNSKS